MDTIPREATELYNEFSQQFKSQSPSAETLQNLFLSVTRNFERVFVIFDGLDECSEIQLTEIIPRIRDLADGTRIFVTSRPHVRDAETLSSISTVCHIAADDSDIRKYLEARLATTKIRLKPILKSNIVEMLAKGADGM